MHLTFLASPLGTCLMPTYSHLIFTLTRQRNKHGGEDSAQKGSAEGDDPSSTLHVLLADPLHTVSWLVYAIPSPPRDVLFQI